MCRTGLGLGVNLWSQASDWPAFLRAAQRADELGYDHFWTWDHLLAIFGDPDQPIFEGYTALAAVAARRRSGSALGLFVGANTFRTPGLAVKAITTIDHISGGRAIMGIGGAWFEARAPGVRPRLRVRASGSAWTGWPRPSRRCARCSTARRSRARRAGTTRSTGCGSNPPPLQPHLPIMIGGTGERKTLRIVAEHADIWNVFGTPEIARPQGRRAAGALRRRRARPGGDRADGRLQDHDPLHRGGGRARPPGDARAQPDAARGVDGDETFWTGTPEQIAETMVAYRRIGFHTFIVELRRPVRRRDDGDARARW